MKPTFPYSLFPLGDSALIIDFGNTIDTAINNYVLTLFEHFKMKNIPGVVDIVPAYSSLSFHYNILTVRESFNNELSAFDIISKQIKSVLIQNVTETKRQKNKIKIPVCYSRAFAPDIEFVAAEKNIAIEKIIQLHSERIYKVYMIGFLPGFPYMGEINEAINIPRKTQPSTNVLPGSVGIAGKQTGIYPFQSPGGWQIIGRTPLKIFDKEKREPVLLHPGDEVQFYSITEDEFKNY